MKAKKTKKNKIAIVGLTHEGKRAPFDDDTFEIWTLNSGFHIYPIDKIDILFDMHDWKTAEYEAKYNIELKENVYPFAIINMVDDSWPAGFQSTRYPFEKVEAEIPYYMSCSLTYILAYALVMRQEPIYIFGTNMVEFAHHVNMMNCWYYMLGYARGKNRNVYLTTAHTLDLPDYYGTNMTLGRADREEKFLDNYIIKGNK